MNKKLTPLEAFAKVKDRLEIWDCSEESNWEEYGTGSYECEEELDIIEKELKREDSIEITAIDIEQDNKELCKENKKLKQVLEIIKEKKVNLEYLKCCETYEQYKTICSYWNEITKEEFDLLKKNIEK